MPPERLPFLQGPLECYIHTPTSQPLCGPLELIRKYVPVPHLQQLVCEGDVSRHETVVLEPSRDADVEADLDWRDYLEEKLELRKQEDVVVVKRDALPEPVPVVEKIEVRAPKRKGGGYSSSSSSPGSRVVVGSLGFWIVLGWVVSGLV